MSAAGSTVRLMVASIVSAMHFMPTHRPEKRESAMAFTPYSSTSPTSAGSSMGISRSAKAYSEPLVTVEDLEAGSSPARARTLPSGAVPAPFAWRSTSPLRSTPGPLPYQMAKTPRCFALG